MKHSTPLFKASLHKRIKALLRLFLVLFLGLVAATNLQAATITHDISTGDLSIPGTSTDDYIITGSTTSNSVTVGSGYHGNITLRNLSIIKSNGASCITVVGQYNCSNLAPVTKVNFILDGANELKYTSSTYCALQVDQGAQIQISAIDPNDDTSGSLSAKSSPYQPGDGNVSQAGAGIGAPSSIFQGTSVLSCGGTGNTAGGNIIISSGTITAWGGHGAGIGGGFWSYYNGIIIVYGGVVEARGGFDAAGIGSGCPQGTGIIECYADISTVVALPPAQITAFGAGANANGGVGTLQFPELGLTGTKNITYINDPNKPIITVRTDDYEPNANIYLDLTETPGLVTIFETLEINYDLTKVKVGKTDASGLMSFHARFEQNTTFFTDASSTQPTHFGRPYLPVKRTVLGEETIVLPLLNTEIAFTDYPSKPLEVGYSAAQAKQNAHCMKVKYTDVDPMTDVTFTMQGGLDFASLVFLSSDSTTVIPTPTTLSEGDVFFIILPLNVGKPIGLYSDVLLIDGNWRGTALPGYIRRIGEQRVVFNDTETNNYIKVTASPNKFAVSYPSSDEVTLTLNINHSGITVPYNRADVTAKYLVTTEADYDAALAATPLSSWSALNIPISENTNTTTTVSFSGKAVGVYYIHWYVVSGVTYAHSRAVADPLLQYGGFGPYKISVAIQPGEISGPANICTGMTASLTGEASTGGSGIFTYKWQSSADETLWTDLSNSNSKDYTTGTLSSSTYFRRQTIDGTNGTFYSDTIRIIVSPTEMYWSSTAANSNWNDPANWVNFAGVALNAVPASCTNVHIPGNATNYPSLDIINTPQRAYGAPTCKDIIYHFGAEVAQPQLLTYERAFVDYNFGYFDASYNYKTDGDPRSATPMKRGQWYALAAPLKNMVSGDFSLGGYPNMWQQELQLTTTTLGDFAGAWKTPDGSNALELGADRAYAISVWAGDYIPGTPGEGVGYHDSLNVLKGILEMPYFENPTVSRLHRIHSYNGSSSTFKYYNSHLPLLDITNDEPGRIVRGNEAYRFIFDGKLLDGDNFKVTVPAGQEIMVGNPFISTLDFRKFYELNQANMDAYYRLYVDNVWQSYSYSDNTGASGGFIAPLQAFFISTLGTPGTTVDLTFPVSMVSVTKPTNKLRSSAEENIPEDVLVVNAKNSKGNSSVIISMNNMEKNVPQLFSADYPEVPQIYTLGAGHTKNVIQHEGSYNTDISFGVWCNKAENITLNFQNLENMNVESLQLLDKGNNTITNLLKQNFPGYTFLNDPTINDRFVLMVGKNKVTTGIDVTETSTASIYAVGRTLHVKANQEITGVSVSSVQGLLVSNDSNITRSEYVKDIANATAGVYIVTARLQDGSTITKKIIFK